MFKPPSPLGPFQAARIMMESQIITIDYRAVAEMEQRRLDWLEKMASKPGGLLLHSEVGSTGRVGLGLAQPTRTLRQAIDEAMR